MKYVWGERRGKTRKHEKVEVKRKWWVLMQPPYSLQGNGRQLPRVEPFNQRNRPPDVEENLGSHNVKGWEDKQDDWCIPDSFT